MSDLQFEQDKEWIKLQQNSYWNQSETMPILVRLAMKLGLQRRQSYYLLFGILIVCTFLTFEITKKTFFNNSTSMTYKEDIPDEIKKTIPKDVLDKLPSRNTK